MASWTKLLTPYHIRNGNGGSGGSVTPNSDNSNTGTSAKYASYLPEVYAGHPNRIQRYAQYEEMNRDSFIRAALDTIAEFCTQSEEASDNPFEIVYQETATEPETKILKEMLTAWTNLNEFTARLFAMFRNTIMNGDSFYLRDPETSEWTFLDHYAVIMAKVDEQNGRNIEEYLVKGFDDFRRARYSSRIADLGQYRSPNGMSPMVQTRTYATPGSTSASTFQMAGSDRDNRHSRLQQNYEYSVLDAKNVIHLSMSDGLDNNWPFGPSILESVFKVWKQKELLEDAIIIYRVARAPERRIFYIDVGQMNPVMARQHVESIKNEMHQRRIPTRAGGGGSMVDAAYNPLSMMDDYFFSQTSDGRGSKVEVLPGGDATGEITDLNYFRRELALGFRIPNTYLPYGGDDTGGGAAYNDGKLGTATIQEFLFTKYCLRLQNRLAPAFDVDFKRFLKENGVKIENSLFRLKFCPPQNFTKYRQIELDTQQVNLLSQVNGMKDVSKRFAKIKYGGWSQDDILENQRMWAEENPAKVKGVAGASMADAESEGDLSSVGVRPMGGDMFGDPMADLPPEGGEPAPDAGAEAAPDAAAPTGPAPSGPAPTGGGGLI